MSLPLDGVRVLSLAHQYPDPYATMLLSDLGADVVLVERPDGGDPAPAFAGFPYEPGYGVFGTADGHYLALGVAHEDHFWRRLCEVTGLATDAALSSPQRFEQHERLRGRLAAALRTRTRQEWVRIFDAADIPFGEVRGLAEQPGSAQVAVRQMMVTDPETGQVYVRQPLTVDGARPGPRGGVPALGEHTAEVLADAGLGPERIEALLTSGACEVPN